MSQCAAITLYGTRCSRKPQKNSIFCWQHQGYKMQYTTVNPVKTGVIKKSTPAAVGKVVSEFPETAEVYTPKGEIYQLPKLHLRVDDVDLRNLDLSLEEQDKLTDLAAVGPATLVCTVGEYDDTIIKFDIEFKEGEHTFEELISDIYDLYDRITTLEQIDKLITVARKNRDQLSEGLYAQIRLRIKRGEQIPLYELNGNRLLIDKIILDKDGRYFLKLKNV